MLGRKKKTGVDFPIKSPKEVIDGLMLLRGISPLDETFIAADLKSLSDPMSLGDGASLAANMLIGCCNKECAVIGDYDADGIVSSAIIRRTVEMFGGRCSVFLPSRWRHGYGLNDKTVSDFKSKFEGCIPEILFVVDCGSSSEEYILDLKLFGIKQIAVIDHHIVRQSSMSTSVDAHVNWRQFGSAKNLCAAGEVFHVARLALMRSGKDWEWMLPFAAIATVGDSVPITGDNRIIVKNGADLQRIAYSGSPGLQSLATKRCREGVSQKSLSFYIVPMINAAGRVSDPDEALKLLLEKDVLTATRLMMLIESHNNERKEIQENIFRQGMDMIGGQNAKPPFVFLHQPDWNIGVCGISCSQMVEKYGVPAMMFGTYDGKVKGSGRSIPGVNLKAVLDECGDEVFEKYGGHEMACGATVRGGMFAEAQKRFATALQKISSGQFIFHVPEYDFDLEPELITYDLGNILFERLYPYCTENNPEPIFKIANASVQNITENHYKVYTKLDFMVEKNGQRISIPMSAFLKDGVDDHILSLKKGDIADFYFSFPQTLHSEFGFGDNEYHLELVDVEKNV